MWTARLLIGILALALLAPIPAAAAPAASFHSCDAMLVALPPPVREALLRMGGTLTAIDETTVTLGGQQVTLRVCAPAAQRLQALRMLDLIAVALPALERHAGVHDLGGMEREIIILPTAEMDDLGADGVHTDAGVIYLHASSFEWAVVHEAAHYWARPDTFAEGWMVEGYADYLTELAAAELPTPLVSPQPDSRCEGVALAAERRISRCIYRRGAQVFRDMAAAVGPDLLRTTLRQLSDGRRRVDSWRLMVALELASGKDLSAIFDGMVFPFGADEVRRWIELRSALWLAQRLAEAEQLALPEWLALAEADWRRGAIPSPALQEGRPAPEAFTPEMRDAEALLHPLVAALRQVGEVRQLCARLALTCATPWRPLPTLPEPAAQLAADLTAAIGLLGAYSQLVQEAAAAEVAAPAPLKRIAESLDIGGGHAIQRARDLLPRAVALDGACKAYPAPCAGGWHAAWSSGDLDAVERTVSVLEAVLERARQVEASCGETLEGCRRIWQSALEAGGPPAAEESLAHLEQLRAGAQQVSAACRSLGEECWQVWERPLAAGDLRGAQAALAAARDLLDEARASVACRELGAGCTPLWLPPLREGRVDAARAALRELDEVAARAREQAARCEQAGVACETSWQHILEAEGIAGGYAALDRVDGVLDRLVEAERAVSAPPDLLTRLIAHALRTDPERDVAAAKEALRRGDLEGALALSAHARLPATIAAWIRPWLPLGGAAVLALVLGASALAGVLWWRRPRRPRRPPRGKPPAPQDPSGRDLLAELLARPPGGGNDTA